MRDIVNIVINHRFLCHQVPSKIYLLYFSIKRTTHNITADIRVVIVIVMTKSEDRPTKNAIIMKLRLLLLDKQEH